jgi:hypothetical protein
MAAEETQAEKDTRFRAFVKIHDAMVSMNKEAKQRYALDGWPETRQAEYVARLGRLFHDGIKRYINEVDALNEAQKEDPPNAEREAACKAKLETTLRLLTNCERTYRKEYESMKQAQEH